MTHRGCAASHSRARRCASLRAAGVSWLAARSRLATVSSRSSPVNCEAARLYHMCACTKSFGTPRPVPYNEPGTFHRKVLSLFSC